MKNERKHPLDVIYERLENGYYWKMPPYSFDRDMAFVNYVLEYGSKVDYEIAEAKYKWYNYRPTICREIF